MRRLLWLGVGLAVGALVVRQASKAARAWSPAGLAGAAGNTAAGLWGSVQDFSGRAQQWVGDFVADVREGMAEREEQIQAAFARGDSLADLGLLDDHDLDDLDLDDYDLEDQDLDDDTFGLYDDVPRRFGYVDDDEPTR